MNPQTFQNLKDQSNSATFEKGYNYYLQKRVTSLRIVHDNIASVELHSQVKGNKTYSQSINIIKSSFSYKGFCSCPVGVRCKHIIAALLSYLEQSTLNENHWLERFHNALEEDVVASDFFDTEDILVYRLFEGRDNGINVYKAKEGKKGLTKGVKIPTSTLKYATHSFEKIKKKKMEKL